MKAFRKGLRNHGTAAEAVLWTMLKARQLDGWKFRRQFSVERYVIDFYCPAAKLCIELDGNHHFSSSGFAYDQKRTEFLEKFGIKVIRFQNCEVFDHPDAVLEEIRNNLPQPPLTPP